MQRRRYTTAPADRRARTRSTVARRSTRPATSTRRRRRRDVHRRHRRAPEHHARRRSRRARPTIRRRRSRSPPRPGATFQCRVDARRVRRLHLAAHDGAARRRRAHLRGPRGRRRRQRRRHARRAARSWSTRARPTRRSSRGPAGAINDTTPTFTFSSDEAGATFECSLDGADVRGRARRRSPPAALAEGAHTFAVRATRRVGNVDASPATRAFTVDMTPPAPPEVVSGPAGRRPSPRPRSRSRPPSTVTCRLEGPAARRLRPCASPKSFGALAPGDYVFVVRSVDAAGNADDDPRRVHGDRAQQAHADADTHPDPTPTPTPSSGSDASSSRPRRHDPGRLPGRRTFVPLDVTRASRSAPRSTPARAACRLTALADGRRAGRDRRVLRRPVHRPEAAASSSSS